MRRDGVSTLESRALAAALFVVTFVTFSASLRGGFLDYDDNIYLTENPAIRLGLSLAGVEWAFRSTLGALWMPITWLSFLAEYEVWGLDPRGFHLTNLLLHAANALLAFLAFERMTGRLGSSAAAAALFSLHPLRVGPQGGSRVSQPAETRGVSRRFPRAR